MPWDTNTNIRGIKVVQIGLNCAMIVGSGLIIFHLWKFYGVLTAAYISYMSVLTVSMVLCGLLGIFAILRDNLRLTYTFGAIMLVILLVHIADRLFVSNLFDDSIKQLSRNNVKEKWNEEIEHPGAMDELQEKFACCGNSSYEDYAIVLQRPEVPSSCLRSYSSSRKKSAFFDPDDNCSQPYYCKGCFTGAEKFVFKSFTVSLRANWAAILIGILLLGWMTYITKRNEKRRSNFELN